MLTVMDFWNNFWNRKIWAFEIATNFTFAFASLAIAYLLKETSP